jgi:uncharacterized glyoxalase superfamily metalloenzyme YdcJ
MTPPENRWFLVAMIAVSPPVSLGALVLLRRYDVLEGLRVVAEVFGETATALATTSAVATALGAVAAAPLYRVLYRRSVARLKTPDDLRAKRSAALTALYVSTSVPQLPALFAIILYAVGADLRPAALSVILATVGAALVGLASKSSLP